MSKDFKNQYLPDYLVTPGEVIEDYLEAFGNIEADETIKKIVNGMSPITPEIALKLENMFGRPAHFWNNLESQFQEDRLRLKKLDVLSNL